jgi:hypothetical protein
MTIILPLLCSQWLDVQALQIDLRDAEIDCVFQGE